MSAYYELRVVRCTWADRDIAHMAHVFAVERGEKVVCRGLLPHSVPLDHELPGMWEQADLTGGQTDAGAALEQS